MAIVEMPMLLVMLVQHPMPAEPAVSHYRCGASRPPEAMDCCLNLAIWNGHASTPAIDLPSAQPQADDERTTQDVAKR